MVWNVPEGGGGVGYTLAFMAIVFGPPLLAIGLVVGVVWYLVRRKRRQWPPAD